MTTTSLSNPALLIEDGTKVIVHPVVLLHILDHHGRRQEDRVIGTLLGIRRDDVAGGTNAAPVIEITNCFSVPHAERGDEVAIGKDFNKKMLAMHTRCNPKEVVVGWYASVSGATTTTASEQQKMIADTSYLIHEFYAGECDDEDPIHLVVDTRLQEDCLQIKAYKSASVVTRGEHVGNLFHEMSLTLESNEAETICLHEMIKGTVANGGNGEAKADETLQLSMEKLHALLDSTLEYVQAVVDGKEVPDEEKGRKIADTLATVPRVRPEIFDKLFHNSLQDLLMVSYLSSMTRTQLDVAEKLNASLGTL
jgi:translation initiation factor 3 subunit F